MRKELLLELADFLEKLEPHRFDIRTWRRPTKSTVGYVSDEQLLTDDPRQYRGQQIPLNS